MILVLTWLWQGLAIALGTRALLASTRRLSAATRHATWWVACAAVLALPAAYALAATPPGMVAAATVPTPLLVPAAPNGLVSVAPLVWAVFAGAGLFRVAWSLRTLSRLKRKGEPLGPRSRALHPTASARPAPEVRVCAEVHGACALGLGQPVILVSPALVDRLSRPELEAILLHERAHLERRDDVWQLLQAIIGALAGWHPAIWLIGRRISFEREAACDDRVLVCTDNARDYARALVRVAETRSACRRRLDGVAIPGAATTVSALRRRVRLLLDRRVNRAAAPALVTTGLLAAALFLTVFAAARAPGVFVLVDAVTNLPGLEFARGETPYGLELPQAVAPPGASAARAVGASKPATTIEAQPPAGSAAGNAPAAVSTAHPLADVPAAIAATGITSVLPAMQHDPAVLAGEFGTPAPLLPSRTTPWATLARSGTPAARTLAGTGAVTRDRAGEAGRSIGRFFTKAATGIAGSL